MQTELVEFKTADGLFLPGLLYQPRKRTKKVLLILHGNGSASVFYKVTANYVFARKLQRRGIAYFPFNNRGAHYIKKLRKITKQAEEERVQYGMAYELIKECIQDIEGAVKFLKQRGFSEFYLYGHSTGANKICVYNYYRPKNKIAKYILAGGGDDTGLYYAEIGSKKKFLAYLAKAKVQIERGKGRKLIPKYMLAELLSYQSFYDICNPDGDYNTFPFNEYINKLNLSTKPLFRAYKAIKKPTLVVYGENDEFCYGDVRRVVNILKNEAPRVKLFTFKIIPGADHSFHRKEQNLAETVAAWLAKA